MPSEKFRITTNGQSLRNPNNGFFGMTLSANMTLDERYVDGRQSTYCLCMNNSRLLHQTNSDVSAHNDRRSAHNALERQRREHLNVKFQQLAHALPSLQTVRRPSKTMIVAKSLEFVSSSLKRETTYTSEIQKLRLENEKLRKQAEASSNQLKKQIANQDTTSTESDLSSTTPSPKKTTDSNDDNASETSTLIAKKEEEEVKISRKRKASAVSDPQLSPPPTPEAMRGNNKHHPVAIATPVGHQQKKKKMVKQTKTLPATAAPITVTATAPTSVATVPSTTTTIPVSSMAQQLPMYNATVSAASLLSTPAASLIDSPWSPIDDGHLQSSLLTTYPPNTITNNQTNNTHNYFDMTSPSSSSSANMLYDLYTDNIHPMLLAPYYIPSETTTSTTSATTTSLYAGYPTANINYQHFNHTQQPHQRHQSGGHQGHDFYLS
ncbi:hypothetical protein MAM1_0166d07053 [Mucor ambiguus]|uniref:BHLH domain-containing protein n=1 Tax=Mucor ambiguus TaxID=91626 RepID=A0A0C9MZ44_9FUNG|nr:hypothetical protein MAM1_0166d07053 [Mucor ambiguus]